MNHIIIQIIKYITLKKNSQYISITLIMQENILHFFKGKKNLIW
jgi:hypothetical protein